MSLLIILSEEAHNDFDQAVDWHELQQIGLGTRFVDCIQKALAQIAAMPNAHRIRWKNTRRASVPVFRYGIFYEVHADKVVVTAILHDRRDPRIWKQRS